MSAEADAIARDYLLGALPEDRAAALEHSLLTDRELLERVEQIEEDLIGDYVADRLPIDAKARFERHYLSSALHGDRVAVARALADYRKTPPANAAPQPRRISHAGRALGTRPPILGWAAVTALAAIVLWLSIRPAMLAPEPAPPAVADAPRTSPRVDASHPAPLTRVTLALSPIAMRSRGATPRLVVPSDAAVVDLRLEGASAPETHLPVEVRSVNDQLVWTGMADRAPAAAPYAWTVSVPANRLVSDDHILTLFDTRAQVAARYFFRVVREPDIRR